MTYDELQTAVRTFVQSNDDDFLDTLPLLIRLAEERLLKDSQLAIFQRNATSNAFPGVKYMPYPQDFLAPMSYIVFVDGQRQMIRLKDTGFVQAVEPDGTVEGPPKYYALFDESNFIFSPTPDEAYPLELQYLYRPASITAGAGSGTTWLSRNATSALLYGTIVEAYVFLKGEDDVHAKYMDRYMAALRGLKQLGEAKQTTDHYRYGRLIRPKE
jgi:hypothetical protein